MQADFWHKRWEQGQIGFHSTEVNPYLQQYWPGLGLAAQSRVLVPLCGKSLDLLWLADRGHQVLGIELSQKAVEDFFHEHQLQPETRQQGAFTVYAQGPIQIWCGDFFALTAQDIADCTALYDRAAMIALPQEMRQRYSAHLNGLLPAGTRGLLITMDYDQAQLDGPPFAVLDDEVRQRLEGSWQLQVETERDILGESWKFLQGGVTRLVERVYRLEKQRER
ncbi:thiopurine S-methyltransferase [Pseudomonas sessilinigenes]|uniref:Thiopurine S-methyltransferase n=1 Tax=Pseudomonas sessilinigenes TaxID=658629 RepID=A0ABX8ML04_9PSED|nr:thiopurine S-methyltransferase [Pseudomonas sessilinigenes]AZC27801.1 Thiopurine S-methyltransferase [Pseudomonas sessilinigenes]QXH38320.1 thiopurine S-methyltransferase [Pseudomonas sessilinigenes]